MEKDQQKNGADNTAGAAAQVQDPEMSKNPNPRANENLDREDRLTGDTDDVGSEITDGEDA